MVVEIQEEIGTAQRADSYGEVIRRTFRYFRFPIQGIGEGSGAHPKASQCSIRSSFPHHLVDGHLIASVLTSHYTQTLGFRKRPYMTTQIFREPKETQWSFYFTRGPQFVKADMSMIVAAMLNSQ